MYKKKELIDKLSKKGYTKTDSAMIIDDVFSVITEALAEGNDIMIHGFGKFYVIDTKEYENINPKTNERITIPAQKLPKFSAGDFLRRAVKEGYVRE